MTDLLVEAELKRALAAPGCAVCRMGEEAVRRYLRFVLHESVNDPATRDRLAAAWGFCRRHAWHFLRLESETMRDGLGTANIVEALLRTAEELLGAHALVGSGKLRKKRAARAGLEELLRGLTPTGGCPACDLQGGHEAYSLAVALACLEADAWRERFARSDGFCLSHLRDALSKSEASDRIRWVLEDHRHRLRRLLADLEEYIRKHDYRFSHEEYGQERDAFVRATAALAGSWFDLPGRPAPEAVELKEGEQHG